MVRCKICGKQCVSERGLKMHTTQMHKDVELEASSESEIISTLRKQNAALRECLQRLLMEY